MRVQRSERPGARRCSQLVIDKPLSRTNTNYFIFASPKLSRRVESCQSISSPKLVSMPNQFFLRNRSLLPIMRSCEDGMYHHTLFFYLDARHDWNALFSPFSVYPLSFWLPFIWSSSSIRQIPLILPPLLWTLSHFGSLLYEFLLLSDRSLSILPPFLLTLSYFSSLLYEAPLYSASSPI